MDVGLRVKGGFGDDFLVVGWSDWKSRRGCCVLSWGNCGGFLCRCEGGFIWNLLILRCLLFIE